MARLRSPEILLSDRRIRASERSRWVASSCSSDWTSSAAGDESCNKQLPSGPRVHCFVAAAATLQGPLLKQHSNPSDRGTLSIAFPQTLRAQPRRAKCIFRDTCLIAQIGAIVHRCVWGGQAQTPRVCGVFCKHVKVTRCMQDSLTASTTYASDSATQSRL